jgi:transcriptional antiterminator RfaH
MLLSKDAPQGWHVVYTMPKSEKKIHHELLKKGVEAYLPIVSKVVKWSDRKKKISTPLFPNYVFLRPTNAFEKELVYRTQGVVRFISCKGKPETISDAEIDLIKKALAVCESPEKLCDQFLVGDEVQIISGHFKGQSGLLLRKNGANKVAIYLSGIKQSIVLEIALNELAPKNSESSHHWPYVHA